jgi:hypothetical protein
LAVFQLVVVAALPRFLAMFYLFVYSKTGKLWDWLFRLFVRVTAFQIHIAGTAPPLAKITLLVGGGIRHSTFADENGRWTAAIGVRQKSEPPGLKERKTENV